MNKVYGNWAQVKNPAIIDLQKHHEESDDLTDNNQDKESSIDEDDELSTLSNKTKILKKLELATSTMILKMMTMKNIMMTQILTFKNP